MANYNDAALNPTWPALGSNIRMIPSAAKRLIWSAAAESRLVGTATALWIKTSEARREESKAVSPLRSATALQILSTAKAL